MIRYPDLHSSGLQSDQSGSSYPEYSLAFDRVTEQLRQHEAVVAAERHAAEGRLAELLAMPAGRRRLLAANSERFRSLSLCQALIRESHRQGFEDRTESLVLAEIAVEIAQRLDSSLYGVSCVEDLRGRCWGQLGNARRINSDLRGAEEAFRIAEVHIEAGTGDSLELGRLLDLVATLRKVQNRVGESKRLQRAAIDLYREIGDCHLTGRGWIKMAALHNLEGEAERALSCLGQGLALIDAQSEPVLAAAAAQELTVALLEAGRCDEALDAMHRARMLLNRLENQQVSRVRFRCLEGHIEERLGRLDRAEAALRVARQGFLRLGLSAEVAAVSMDLARIYLRQGRTADLKQLVAEMVPIFESRDLHDAAMAALLLFRQAVETERATLGLVEEVRARLENPRSAERLL